MLVDEIDKFILTFEIDMRLYIFQGNKYSLMVCGKVWRIIADGKNSQLISNI